MTVQTMPWESRLLDQAREALEHLTHASPAALDQTLLQQGYRACAGITRTHSRTFMLASSLLPQPKRKAVRALYAFCRISDDIVDCSTSAAPAAELAAWRLRSLAHHPAGSDAVSAAWADARACFGIPVRYAEQLLDAVASDLTGRRYPTFDDLAAYAYGVASTVGLMAMHIIGFAGEEAMPYAIKMGVALQVTNILRDVKEDWARGRLYLPLDDMDRFGITEQDLTTGQVTPRWRAFMRFQIQRVRQLFADSFPGIALLDPDGRFAIAAAARLYESILDDIEAHGYNVFTRRARVSLPGKIRRLPGIWLKTQALEDRVVWFDS